MQDGKIVRLQTFKQQQEQNKQRMSMDPRDRIAELEAAVLRLSDQLVYLDQRVQGQASFIQKFLRQVKQEVARRENASSVSSVED